MAKWLAPLAFMRWLLAGERLETAPNDADRVAEGKTTQGFWGWLFSSEELPEIDSAPSESQPTSLLRFILASERLPEPSAGKISGASNSTSSGRNQS